MAIRHEFGDEELEAGGRLGSRGTCDSREAGIWLMIEGGFEVVSTFFVTQASGVPSISTGILTTMPLNHLNTIYC